MDRRSTAGGRHASEFAPPAAPAAGTSLLIVLVGRWDRGAQPPASRIQAGSGVLGVVGFRGWPIQRRTPLSTRELATRVSTREVSTRGLATRVSTREVFTRGLATRSFARGLATRVSTRELATRVCTRARPGRCWSRVSRLTATRPRQPAQSRRQPAGFLAPTPQRRSHPPRRRRPPRPSSRRLPSA